MIAKGNLHNSGPYLARYLAADSKGNERAELAEIRGFATENVFDAFALGQLMAEGTKCKNPFFHVQVRTPVGEELTREQWQRVAERLERKLGFRDQPRAIVFHQKAGHEHMHLVWSRIGEDMRAIDPGLYKNKLKEACRALEKEMGLKRVRNERDPEEKTQPANRGEFEQARRLKTDLKTIRESIRDCWDTSSNGAGLSVALESKRLILAHGDRRDFVIVDEKGGMHALSKRITGATAPEMRACLADIDASSLPSIEQARVMQRERLPQGGQEAKTMPQEPSIEDGAIGKEEEQKQEVLRQADEAKREALQKDEERKQQEFKEADERKQQAFVEEDQKKQEATKEAAQKQEEQRQAQFKEQADRLAEQAKVMEQQQLQLDAYKAELTRQAEEGRQQAEHERQAQAEGRARDYEIRNPHYRYGQALAQHYDVKDPYGSLARSSMAEYGTFLRDRENIERQIAQAKDPAERETLELRKRIEAAEYMAITSDRIAVQSEIIVGRRNTDEALKQRERAATFRKEAQELRQEFRNLNVERAGGRSERTTPKKTPAQAQDSQRDDGLHPPQPEPREEQPPVQPPRLSPGQASQQPEPLKTAAAKAPEATPAPKDKTPEIRRDPSHEQKTGARGLMVEERPTGKPRGEPQSLNNFMQGVSLPKQQAQQTFTPAQIRNDPAAKRAHYGQLVAEQKRGDALDRIGEDMKAGRNLSADDMRKLSRDDLESIKAQGDDHLKQLTQEREQQRAREPERER